MSNINQWDGVTSIWMIVGYEGNGQKLYVINDLHNFISF